VLFPLCCAFVVEHVKKGLLVDDIKDPDSDFPDGGDYGVPDEITLRQDTAAPCAAAEEAKSPLTEAKDKLQLMVHSLAHLQVPPPQ
jgi:hypothetical protein